MEVVIDAEHLHSKVWMTAESKMWYSNFSKTDFLFLLSHFSEGTKYNRTAYIYIFKITFLKKILFVHVSFLVPSVRLYHQKNAEPENFTKLSSQMNFKGGKNAFRTTFSLPLTSTKARKY